MILSNPLFSSLIRLVPYLKPYKISLLRAFAALCVAAGLVLISGRALQYFIDDGLTVQDLNLFHRGMMSSFIFCVLLALASYVRLRTTTWISEQVVADLRQDLFRHLLYLDQTFMESAKVGELMARLESDITSIRLILSSSIAVSLRSLLQLLGALGFLLYTSPKLFSLVLLITPFSLLPLIIIGRHARPRRAQAQQSQDFLSAYAHDILLALSTVQAFCQEHAIFKKYQNGLKTYLAHAHQQGQTRALMIACIIGLVLFAIMVVLSVGINDVLQHRLSFGVLVSFLFYAVVAAGSLNSLNDVSHEIKGAMDALNRVFALHQASLPRPFLTKVSPSSKTAFSFEALAFKEVCFSYPTRLDQPALQQISFEIKQGQTCALVGTSGAGKSTIFHLLQGFYRPQSGAIFINGEDIITWPLDALRQLMATVSQDPPLLNATLHENIAFSRPDASVEEIQQVAHLCAIHEFVQQWPQGFETKVGERGMRLSGGQKQRIALARALLYQAPLLLLDEATNALDSQIEHQVQQALDQAFASRTRFIIAHRLSTVIQADQIIVLDQGRIVDSGTHKSLLQRNALYQNLCAQQFLS